MGSRTAAWVVLGLFAATLPGWGQNQSSRNESPYGSPDDPPIASQPAPQQNPPQQPQQEEQIPPQNAPAPQQRPRAHEQPAANAPARLTLPRGAIISVRVSQWLSSDINHAGDTFTAVLDEPLVVHGWVVARRGQTVIGQVEAAQKASENNGVSKLGLGITELTLVDGEQVSISTEMQQAAPPAAPPGSAERNVATVGTTTAIGTIVGAAVGRGVGAAIGAGLGATAGLAAVLSTRGRPTMIAPETLLSFRLAAPVEISTERGPLAFQPIKQGDYKDQDAYAPRLQRRGAGPGYPPAPYYYGYCGAWGWGCYPYYGPYIGIGVWGPGWYGRRWR